MEFDLDLFVMGIKHQCKKFNISNAALDACFHMYMEYKNKINAPQSENGHYIYCEWSNPACEYGADTCQCYYICSYIPRTLPTKFVEAMGYDFIIASLKADGYNVI
jgi:hypothetical protein